MNIGDMYVVFQIISKTLSVLFHSLLCTSDGLKNVLRRKETDRKNPNFWRENLKYRSEIEN